MRNLDTRRGLAARFASTAIVPVFALVLAGTAAASDRPVATPAVDRGAPVRMIRTGSNQSPQVAIYFGMTNYTVDTDVYTYDPDGHVVYMVIDFGDGATANVAGSTAQVSHTYASPGNYTVSVTAIDNDGGVGFGSRTIWVSGGDSI